MTEATKCIVTIDNPHECLMCGRKDVSSRVKNGKIYAFSECSYDLGQEIKALLKQIDLSLEWASRKLAETK